MKYNLLADLDISSQYIVDSKSLSTTVDELSANDHYLSGEIDKLSSSAIELSIRLNTLSSSNSTMSATIDDILGNANELSSAISSNTLSINTIISGVVSCDVVDSKYVIDPYVKSTGSTTPRKLSERFNDYINVKDFGAKGDGSTDDTDAFQRAIQAGEGKTIYVPAGEYLVSNTPSTGITISNEMHIVGSDRLNTIIRPYVVGATIFYIKHDAVEIADISFADCKTASADNARKSVYIEIGPKADNTVVSDTLIHGCRFKDAGVAIACIYNANDEIYECVFETCFNGIVIDKNDSGTEIINNYFIWDYTLPNEIHSIGIRQHSGHHLIVDDNRFVGLGYGYVSEPKYGITNTTLSRNTFMFNETGILFSYYYQGESGRMVDTSITNNDFIFSGAEHRQIGIHFTKNDPSVSLMDGYHVGTVISGNRFGRFRTSLYGMLFDYVVETIIGPNYFDMIANQIESRGIGIWIREGSDISIAKQYGVYQVLVETGGNKVTNCSYNDESASLPAPNITSSTSGGLNITIPPNGDFIQFVTNTWQSGKEYKPGQIILYGVNAYECLAPHTSGDTFDSSKFVLVAYANRCPMNGWLVFERWGAVPGDYIALVTESVGSSASYSDGTSYLCVSVPCPKGSAVHAYYHLSTAGGDSRIKFTRCNGTIEFLNNATAS